METILKVEGINVYYGAIHAIKDISFEVNQGEIVTLIGANGAGKTTTLQTISGLLHTRTGSITFQGQNITNIRADKLVSRGLAQVPEGRRVFLQMTVEDNLEMGAYTQPNASIAAGIADLAHVYPDSVVCDPMCGSGTLMIESALKAMNIAPGINRHFAAEQWGCFPADVWQRQRSACLDEINRDAPFEAFGSDIDPEAVRLTVENASNAGVANRIHVQQLDMRKFEFPEAERRLIMLCNPPYGERILDIKEAEELYRALGKLCEPAPGRSFNIISPHDEFESLFGRKADRRRKLYNGMIKCQLYMYFK